MIRSSLFMVLILIVQNDAWTEELGERLRLRERDYLFGSWGGLRDRLEEHGLEFDLTYTSTYHHNVNGGIKEGGAYRGDLSFQATLDTEAAGWWSGGEFFLYLQGQHGNGPSELRVGDFQFLNLYESDDFAQVTELWYKHTFFEGKLFVKFGKQDSNADFAYTEYGYDFLHTSAFYSPTIPIVTWEDTDWGITLGASPTDWFSITVGAFNGRPDGGRSLGDTIGTLVGPMVMVEPAFYYAFGEKPGSLRLGYWWNGDEFERLGPEDDEDGADPSYWLELLDAVRVDGLLTTYLGGFIELAAETVTGVITEKLVGPDPDEEAHGFYATLEQELYREDPEDEDSQRVGLFLQFGWSENEVIEVDRYFGLGLEWIGPSFAGKNDVIGLALFHAQFSDRAGFDKPSETAFELFYKRQVTPWFHVKPDVQYIVNPSGMARADAFVVGLEAQVSF